MNRKRGMAAIVLGILLAPPPTIFTAVAAHGCNGFVCACAHHAEAPPPRPSASPCHGAAAVPRCAMRGSCRHDLPAMATAPPYVLPAPVGLPVDVSTDFRGPSLPVETTPGYLRVEPPPPKAA